MTANIIENSDLVFFNDNYSVVTSTEIIARKLDKRHQDVIELTRKYQKDLEKFGRVTFKTEPFATNGGTQYKDIAELTEHQATLLICYMRNSEKVRKFKIDLVKAFFALKSQINKTYGYSAEQIKEIRNLRNNALEEGQEKGLKLGYDKGKAEAKQQLDALLTEKERLRKQLQNEMNSRAQQLMEKNNAIYEQKKQLEAKDKKLQEQNLHIEQIESANKKLEADKKATLDYNLDRQAEENAILMENLGLKDEVKRLKEERSKSIISYAVVMNNLVGNEIVAFKQDLLENIQKLAEMLKGVEEEQTENELIGLVTDLSCLVTQLQQQSCLLKNYCEIRDSLQQYQV